MGADLIGWRNCELQSRTGRDGFLAGLKMCSYQRMLETKVPPERRGEVKIQLLVHRPEGPVQRSMSYAEIRAQAEPFAAGIPACATCPLSGGKPLGCYRYVTYPIDPVTEQTIFDLFVAEVGTAGSIVQRIYDARLARIPGAGTPWHVKRGPDPSTGALAERLQPLVHTWGGWLWKKRVDSAQILVVVLNPEAEAASLALHAELFARIAKFAVERGVSSRGLDEIAGLVPLLAAVAEHARADRWSVVVDA